MEEVDGRIRGLVSGMILGWLNYVLRILSSVSGCPDSELLPFSGSPDSELRSVSGCPASELRSFSGSPDGQILSSARSPETGTSTFDDVPLSVNFCIIYGSVAVIHLLFFFWRETVKNAFSCFVWKNVNFLNFQCIFVINHSISEQWNKTKHEIVTL